MAGAPVACRTKSMEVASGVNVRAEERHARLRGDDLHVAGGRRLADPEAVVVAVVLHVGDVSPVGRDRRPLGGAARRQLGDLQVSERRTA